MLYIAIYIVVDNVSVKLDMLPPDFGPLPDEQQPMGASAHIHVTSVTTLRSASKA